LTVARDGGDHRRRHARARRQRTRGDALLDAFDARECGEPNRGGAATYWSPEKAAMVSSGGGGLRPNGGATNYGELG